MLPKRVNFVENGKTIGVLERPNPEIVWGLLLNCLLLTTCTSSKRDILMVLSTIFERCIYRHGRWKIFKVWLRYWTSCTLYAPRKMFRHICCIFHHMGIYYHMSTTFLPVDLGSLVLVLGMSASSGWKLPIMKRRNFPWPFPQVASICNGITSDLITNTASNGKHVVHISEASDTAWVSWSGIKIFHHLQSPKQILPTGSGVPQKYRSRLLWTNPLPWCMPCQILPSGRPKSQEYHILTFSVTMFFGGSALKHRTPCSAQMSSVRRSIIPPSFCDDLIGKSNPASLQTLMMIISMRLMGHRFSRVPGVSLWHTDDITYNIYLNQYRSIAKFK